MPFGFLHKTINRITTTIGIKAIPKYFSCTDGSEQQNNKPYQAKQWRKKLRKKKRLKSNIALSSIAKNAAIDMVAR